VGTGEGVLNIFNQNEWGNISDRFPGHPSSIDALVPLNSNIVLTGCFDGNIRSVRGSNGIKNIFRVLSELTFYFLSQELVIFCPIDFWVSLAVTMDFPFKS
jgi:hypothetical protein